ncbi:hypothetical protein B0H14DRAFT_3074178 [Mycena olivaceomarginata]|nr:hypothetical protein B0H14DRAFT_3074178 [Mycena olivaceomarginata]
MSFISSSLIHGPHTSRDPIPIFWHPISCPRTDARTSAVLPPRLAAPLGRPFPQTQLHTGTRDPIRPPVLPLSPHANAHANVHSYSYPAPAVRAHSYFSTPPAASEGKDDTICVRWPSYSSPTSTHFTHAVAFPVSPHRYASAPTPMPTYTSTLSPPTPPGMPPMVWSVSSLPAPVEREGEEAESRARIAPLLPLFRRVCIGDANDDAVLDPGGTRRRRTMRMCGGEMRMRR